MPYPPVQHPPHGTPYLNAVLVFAVAAIVGLVAALAGRVEWLIAAGLVALGALVVMGWLENR